MEPGSKPYFPSKKQKKGTAASIGGGSRPGTAKSEMSGVSGISGTTAGSRGPRSEPPEYVRRKLKATAVDGEKNEGTSEQSTGPGTTSHGGGRPKLARRHATPYTQQWVRNHNNAAMELPPLAPRISLVSTTSSSCPPSPMQLPASCPAIMVPDSGLNVIREETSTPVWLAEERNRLLLQRARCMLDVRAAQEAVDNGADPGQLERTEEELKGLEGKLMEVRLKAAGAKEVSSSEID